MKMLVAIDLQKDFTTGVLGNAECDKAADKAAERIAAFRRETPDTPVIFTLDTHTEDYMNTQEERIFLLYTVFAALMAGSWTSASKRSGLRVI